WGCAAAGALPCAETLCGPPAAADRRYAGVTHIDVTRLGNDEVGRISELCRRYGIALSGLGYYPNPLTADAEQRRVVIDHLKKVISAAPRLGVGVVNTCPGRDPARSVDDNWTLLRQGWPEGVRHAGSAGGTRGSGNWP